MRRSFEHVTLPPVPLSELEKLLVVTTCDGNTGSHHMIYR
jgi:hypothetical protein